MKRYTLILVAVVCLNFCAARPADAGHRHGGGHFGRGHFGGGQFTVHGNRWDHGHQHNRGHWQDFGLRYHGHINVPRYYGYDSEPEEDGCESEPLPWDDDDDEEDDDDDDVPF